MCIFFGKFKLRLRIAGGNSMIRERRRSSKSLSDSSIDKKQENSINNINSSYTSFQGSEEEESFIKSNIKISKSSSNEKSVKSI